MCVWWGVGGKPGRAGNQGSCEAVHSMRAHVHTAAPATRQQRARVGLHTPTNTSQASPRTHRECNLCVLKHHRRQPQRQEDEGEDGDLAIPWPSHTRRHRAHTHLAGAALCALRALCARAGTRHPAPALHQAPHTLLHAGPKPPTCGRVARWQATTVLGATHNSRGVTLQPHARGGGNGATRTLRAQRVALGARTVQHTTHRPRARHPRWRGIPASNACL